MAHEVLNLVKNEGNKRKRSEPEITIRCMKKPSPLIVDSPLLTEVNIIQDKSPLKTPALDVLYNSGLKVSRYDRIIDKIFVTKGFQSLKYLSFLLVSLSAEWNTSMAERFLR